MAPAIAAHKMGQNLLERDELMPPVVVGGTGTAQSALLHLSSITIVTKARNQIVMENWFNQMGIGTKQLTERYAEHPAPVHDPQLYYSYEPSSPSHGHVASSKHHYSSGGHKNNAAMSALTLLAFLFFLHILQQCLKEHMTAMSTPQVTVVTAGREEQVNGKTSNIKLDRAGVVQATPASAVQPRGHSINETSDERNAPRASDVTPDSFTRVASAATTDGTFYKYRIVNYTNSKHYDAF